MYNVHESVFLLCVRTRNIGKALTKFKVASFKFECVIKVHTCICIHVSLWA